MSAYQEKRSVHPQWPPAVGQQNFQLRKIHGNVVDVDRLAIFVAGTWQDARPGVEHHYHSICLRAPLDDSQLLHAAKIVSRKMQLVWWMDVDHTIAKSHVV